jgi:hypothetical protein
MFLRYQIDPHPLYTDLNILWLAAWAESAPLTLPNILSRSLGYIGAYNGDKIIGFVNIAWDGGVHAFILDTCVHH